MDLTREYKELVAQKLVNTVLAAIQKNELTTDDMPIIADTFLGKVDSMKTHDELVVLLKEMVTKWPTLAGLVTIEEGKVKAMQDESAVLNVEELVKNGQINEALDAARAATQV